jgi:hypothetical protein
MDSVILSLTTPLHARKLGVPARPVAAVSTVPATIALGIVRKRRRNFALALRIQQRALEDSKQVATIRRQARGEVDVRYIGRVTKQAVPWHQQRNRPLRIGGSIGHFKVTAGTLGCFGRDRTTDAVLILSNNHVLANENQARNGDSILQPGQWDDGQNPADAVATLWNFVKLQRNLANLVDCAVASVNEGIDHNHRNLTGLGRLSGLGDEFLDVGSRVGKVGRTTGTTHGQVTAFELDNVVIAYDVGNLRFDHQVEIEGEGNDPFSQGGDSGSLIVDKEQKAIALLFAGSDLGGANGKGLTYANPLRSVLEALRVDLVY